MVEVLQEVGGVGSRAIIMRHSPVKFLWARNYIRIRCATSACPPATVRVVEEGRVSGTTSGLRRSEVGNLDTRLSDFLDPLLDLRGVCRRGLVKSGIARYDELGN